MSKNSTKETNQEQESRVIDAAIDCIEEASLLDFTMAAIAKKTELSIGSIYKHVQSKEDVLVAIAVRMLHQQYEILKELLELPLTLPERLVGGLLLSEEKKSIYSFGVHLEMLTGNIAVLQRASSRWVNELRRIDKKIERLFQDAFSGACDSGELQTTDTDRGQTIDSLMFGTWSMCVGFTLVAHQRQARDEFPEDVDLPFPLTVDHALINSLQRLLSAYPWQTPLSAEGIEKTRKLLKEKGLR